MRVQTWVLILVGLAATAHAEKRHGPRVMALDFAPGPELTPTAIQAMNETLSASLREQGFEVITPADIAAALGLERQRQLLGCSESSCLAELGGALGVDYVCRGTVSVLDQDSLISLSLIEPKGTEVNHIRAHVPSRSPSELVMALEKLVPTLTAAVKPHAAGGLQATAPAVTSPPPSAMVEGAPSSGHRGAGLALVIAGAVVTAASAIAGGYALSQRSTWQAQLDDHLSRGEVTQADGVRSKAKTFAVGSGVGAGVGLAALATGTYLLLSGSPSGAGSPQ